MTPSSVTTATITTNLGYYSLKSKKLNHPGSHDASTVFVYRRAGKIGKPLAEVIIDREEKMAAFKQNVARWPENLSAWQVKFKVFEATGRLPPTNTGNFNASGSHPQFADLWLNAAVAAAFESLGQVPSQNWAKWNDVLVQVGIQRPIVDLISELHAFLAKTQDRSSFAKKMLTMLVICEFKIDNLLEISSYFTESTVILTNYKFAECGQDGHPPCFFNMTKDEGAMLTRIIKKCSARAGCSLVHRKCLDNIIANIKSKTERNSPVSLDHLKIFLPGFSELPKRAPKGISGQTTESELAKYFGLYYIMGYLGDCVTKMDEMTFFNELQGAVAVMLTRTAPSPEASVRRLTLEPFYRLMHAQIDLEIFPILIPNTKTGYGYLEILDPFQINLIYHYLRLRQKVFPESRQIYDHLFPTITGDELGTYAFSAMITRFITGLSGFVKVPAPVLLSFGNKKALGLYSEAKVIARINPEDVMRGYYSDMSARLESVLIARANAGDRRIAANRATCPWAFFFYAELRKYIQEAEQIATALFNPGPSEYLAMPSTVARQREYNSLL